MGGCCGTVDPPPRDEQPEIQQFSAGAGGKRGQATLGPIIGTVTGTTARVLYEFSWGCEGEIRADAGKSQSVTCTLTGEVDGSVLTCVREAMHRLPVAFAFDGLMPDAAYTVTVDDDIGVPEWCPRGRLRTISGDTAARPFAAAVVSCNKIAVVNGLRAKSKVDVWDDLAQRAEAGDIDLIIHNGDQIYADEIDAGVEGGEPDSAFCGQKFKLFEDGAKWTPTADMLADKDSIRDYCVEDDDRGFLIEGQLTHEDTWEEQRSNVLQAYRNLYRMSWAHKATRRALAHASNMMVCDDHDICDDWGDRPDQRCGYRQQTPPQNAGQMSPDYWIGKIALQVYYEYQRQLREDVVVNEPVPEKDAPGTAEHGHTPCEGYVQRLGDVGVMFLDCRGPRSFRCPQKDDGSGPVEDPALICNEQWQMMEQTLAEWGGEDPIKYLMFCTPVPPVLFSVRLTQLGGMGINDLRGQFAAKESLAQERSRLLHMLHDFAEGGCEVGLYTGDIHVGLQTDIFDETGKTVFRQLVASSVGNHGAGWSGMLVMKGMMEASEGEIIPGMVPDGQRQWTFNHHDYVDGSEGGAERNYGLARFRTFGSSTEVFHTHVGSIHVKPAKGGGGGAFEPGELSRFVRGLGGAEALDQPGFLRTFGKGTASFRYVHIGGIGMALSDLGMFDLCVGGSKLFDEADQNGIPPGARVGLEEHDGAVRWEVRRVLGEDGNYVVPADVDWSAEGIENPFKPGVKQAEFWAPRVDLGDGDDSSEVVYVRWRRTDGRSSTVLSSEMWPKSPELDTNWVVLYAFRLAASVESPSNKWS